MSPFMSRKLFAVALLGASLPASVLGTTVNLPYNVVHPFHFQPGGDVLDASWNWNVFASASFPQDRHQDRNSMAVPGVGNYGPKTVTATATGAKSEADASLSVTAFANNNVQGSVRSYGFAEVNTDAANAEAFASSTSTFRVRGGTKMKNGRVQWGGFLTATSHGQSTVLLHDPISFDV